MITFVSANAIALIVTNILLCIPLKAFWNRTIHGKCINSSLFFILANVPHIISDICIMVIPLPVLLKLQMSWSKRLATALIFLTGSFGIVGSIYRLYVFVAQRQRLLDDFICKQIRDDYIHGNLLIMALLHRWSC